MEVRRLPPDSNNSCNDASSSSSIGMGDQATESSTTELEEQEQEEEKQRQEVATDPEDPKLLNGQNTSASIADLRSTHDASSSPTSSVGPDAACTTAAAAAVFTSVPATTTATTNTTDEATTPMPPPKTNGLSKKTHKKKRARAARPGVVAVLTPALTNNLGDEPTVVGATGSGTNTPTKNRQMGLRRKTKTKNGTKKQQQQQQTNGNNTTDREMQSQQQRVNNTGKGRGQAKLAKLALHNRRALCSNTHTNTPATMNIGILETASHCKVESNYQYQSPEKIRRGLRRTTEELEAKQRTASATRATSLAECPTEGGPAKPFQRGLRRTEEELEAKQNARNRPADPPGFRFSDAAPSLAPPATINQGLQNDPLTDTTSDHTGPCYLQPALLSEGNLETDMSVATNHATEEFQERILEQLGQTGLQENIDDSTHVEELLGSIGYSSLDDEDESFDAENPAIVRDSGSAGPDTLVSAARQQDPVLPTTRNVSNSELVVAREVEDDTAAVLMEAQEVDPEVLERQEIDVRKRKECRMVGCSIIAVSVSIMAIVLGVKLGREDEVITFPPTHSPSMAPSLPGSPSNSPSSAPSGALDLLLESLPEHTRESLTYDTPQLDAWGWLLNHPNITYLEEWRKEQLFALATFYYSFEGENWDPLIRETWMDYEKEECHWFSSGFGWFSSPYYGEKFRHVYRAASCNDDGEFKSLWLGDLKLSGLSPFIPAEIALLTSLSTIDLSDGYINASLSDMLPSELGQLTTLTQVHFQENDLHGKIPSELGLMTGLTSLDLKGNNAFTGQLPSELGLLSSLPNLQLQDSDLTGTIPSDLGMMTSLTELDILSNALTGPLPSELGLMTSLKALGLRDNAFTGELPSQLGLMTSLISLNLRDNALTGRLPSELGLMTSLIEVRVFHNSLTGQLPSELGMMTSLGRLELHGNALTGSIPSQLALITTGQLPSGLGFMTRINWLRLDNNALSGKLPSELGLMTSLYTLELQENALNGSIPSQLAEIANLELLRLDDNTLSGSIPSQLALITNLERLRLENNTLTGSIPSELVSLVVSGSLTVLTLANNSLLGTIPESLCSLGVFDEGLNYGRGMGLSFDCSDQLCGCCWCPCPNSNHSTLCLTNPIYLSDKEWPGTFPTPLNGSNAITINIHTDHRPEETSFEWSTLDESGQWVVRESGSPTDYLSVHSYTMEVESNSLYRLQIVDRWGDGIERGWFTITNSTASPNFENGTVIWDATGDTLRNPMEAHSEYSLEVFIWVDSNGHAQLVEYIREDVYALGGEELVVLPEIGNHNYNTSETIDESVVP